MHMTFVNEHLYGLNSRGTQEIKAVSSSLVKAKAADLMVGRKVTKDFKKMTKEQELYLRY